jgi:hypothetical protein
MGAEEAVKESEKKEDAFAEFRPLKAKNLRIIDYMGTYYATFDGTRSWKVEKWLFRLLMLCDGKKTTSQIAEHIAKISGFEFEEIRVGLRPVFDELSSTGMISYT